MTHDAKTGWNWTKRPISLAKIHLGVSPLLVCENLFFYYYYRDKFVWNFFWFYFYQPQLSLSNSTSYLKTIDLLPFCSLLQLINWILFIAIYLAPSIYQFGDRTVSSNNIDCFQSVRQLNKIYVAKFGLKYVQTSVLVIHRLNKFSCFVIVMFLWLFCAVSLWMFPKILCFYKWYIPFWHGDNRWKWDSSYSDKFCSRG